MAKKLSHLIAVCSFGILLLYSSCEKKEELIPIQTEESEINLDIRSLITVENKEETDYNIALLQILQKVILK